MEAGTSLIEVMFAMAAGLVVLGATLQALSYFQQQFMRQQREVAQQQDLRLGLEVLEQELRLAGSDSLTTVASDSVEFSVNLHSLSTMVTATAAIGKRLCRSKTGKGGMIGKPLWPVGPSAANACPGSG
jgi:Tfp pilus assembly protein PilW